MIFFVFEIYIHCCGENFKLGSWDFIRDLHLQKYSDFVLQKRIPHPGLSWLQI